MQWIKWIFHLILVGILRIKKVATVEMAVSTQKEILFLDDSDQIRSESFKDPIQALASGYQNVFIIQSEGQQSKLTNISSVKLQQSSQYYDSIPGVTSLVPDLLHSRIFISNGSSIFTLSTKTKAIIEEFNVGDQNQKSLAIDQCQNFLYSVEENGSIFRAPLSQIQSRTLILPAHGGLNRDQIGQKIQFPRKF
jgi:hypothetical protein